MSDRSLSQIAQQLIAIDVAMLVTKTSGGDIAARPMSNNGDVSQTDGTTYHFATDDGRIDDDVMADARCGATYAKGDFYAAVQGEAKLVRDRETMKKHWVPDLEHWFDNGLDSEGLVLIIVKPKRIACWDGREKGELVVE